jgi:hypothetical protein
MRLGNTYKIAVGKYEREITPGTFERTGENNIKMDNKVAAPEAVH